MKRNKGSAFFVVILAMMVLSILGTVFLTLSVSNARSLAMQNYSRQAYYLAKSGADAVSAYIIDIPETDEDLQGKTGTDDTDDFPDYKVEVTGSLGPSSSNLEIKGTATVQNITRTVTAVMRRLKWEDIIDKALYSDEDLHVDGMNVTGDIQSAGDISWSINGNHTFTGDADPNSPKSITVELPTTDSSDHISDIILNNHEIETITETIDTTYQIDNVSINQQAQLSVTANDCEVNLIINKLTVNNVLEVEVIGDGTVNIFITELMEIKTSGYINNTLPENLHIYLMPGTTFDMQANITLNGYIIGPDAHVILQSSNSTIRGAVFAQSITKTVSGGNPNGDVIYIGEPVPEEIPDYLKGYIISEWKD